MRQHCRGAPSGGGSKPPPYLINGVRKCDERRLGACSPKRRRSTFPQGNASPIQCNALSGRAISVGFSFYIAPSLRTISRLCLEWSSDARQRSLSACKHKTCRSAFPQGNVSPINRLRSRGAPVFQDTPPSPVLFCLFIFGSSVI